MPRMMCSAASNLDNILPLGRTLVRFYRERVNSHWPATTIRAKMSNHGDFNQYTNAGFGHITDYAVIALHDD